MWLGLIGRGGTEQIGLAVGDVDGEIDAAINQLAEAFEVGEECFDPGQLGRPDIAGAAAHIVGVAELPVRPGFLHRIFVLLAEGAGTHRSELGELGLGPSELGLPLRELFVFHVGQLPKEAGRKSSLRVAPG